MAQGKIMAKFMHDSRQACTPLVIILRAPVTRSRVRHPATGTWRQAKYDIVGNVVGKVGNGGVVVDHFQHGRVPDIPSVSPVRGDAAGHLHVVGASQFPVELIGRTSFVLSFHTGIARISIANFSQGEGRGLVRGGNSNNRIGSLSKGIRVGLETALSSLAAAKVVLFQDVKGRVVMRLNFACLCVYPGVTHGEM
jgi:hypothetical protein